MLNILRLAAAAAMTGVTKAACAAVLMGSFAGTVYDGTDGQGLFGPPGGDLANTALTGTYSYDTTLLAIGVSGTALNGTGQNGALTVTISINGLNFTFDDSLGATVAFDPTTGELDLSLASGAGGGYNAFSLVVVPGANAATGMGLAPEFPAADLAVSLGSFIIAGNDTTNGNFTLTSISQSNQASVPEPATLSLLLPLVAWLTTRGRAPREGRGSHPSYRV